MTAADRCAACNGCRSIQICRARCSSNHEPGSETQASAPGSPRRRRLENTATVAAILFFPGLSAASLWLAGAI